MNFQADNGFLLSFNRSTRVTGVLVPANTPMWHATKVMSTSANSWWEGGVPPSRGSSENNGNNGNSRLVANAVANAASGVARRLKAVRSAALS